MTCERAVVIVGYGSKEKEDLARVGCALQDGADRARRRSNGKLLAMSRA